MKQTITLLLVVLAASISSLTAQSNEMDVMRKLFSAEKRAITEDFLRLTGTDANAFWELYDAYEAERKEIVDKRLNLIEDYAKQYNSLTNDQASELVSRSFKLRADVLSLQKKYFKKMSKAVDAKTATSFYQLEQYIRAAVNYDLYDAIPFVGE